MYWVNISNFPNYQVSNTGQIRNIKTGRILIPAKQTNGYLIVSLNNSDGKHTKSIHRIVAEGFIENPNGYNQINHKDENKENNSVENLEWCDCQYNIDYTFSKPVIQLDLNGNLVAVWKSASEAGRNGFNQGRISACCRGEESYHKKYKWILEEDYENIKTNN